MILKHLTERTFFERYGFWTGLGYGLMLVYLEPSTSNGHSRYKCEYVLFRAMKGFKKIVLNAELLELYNKENQ